MDVLKNPEEEKKEELDGDSSNSGNVVYEISYDVDGERGRKRGRDDDSFSKGEGHKVQRTT